jgi:hypothetical protein
MDIQEIVRSRQIKHLTHFTRVENLDSIVTHGLLPRSSCKSKNVQFLANDEYRHDGQDATCASISFPNYKMFYRLRQRDPSVKWAVIGLSPSILWTKDCAFCATNAANVEMTSIPIDQRKGGAAFERLFEERGKVKRLEARIPDSYPTDPQAEVLIFSPIEPRFILGVAFDDAGLTKTYAAKYNGAPPVSMKSTFFSYRVDYSHWKL